MSVSLTRFDNVETSYVQSRVAPSEVMPAVGHQSDGQPAALAIGAQNAGSAHASTGRSLSARHFLQPCLCARWDPAAPELARTLAAHEGLDWQEVWRTATDQGVAPLVHHATRRWGCVPADLQASLREAYYQNLARNVFLFQTLEVLLRHLAKSGVPAIVLKGAALSKAVYRNDGLRPMSDLDLLVRHEDVERALCSLRELGYAPRQHVLTDGHAPAYSNQVALARPGGDQEPVEIHWSLFSRTYYYYRVPMNWFWQTARPARFGPVSASVLSPEALLLHLCAHILQHGGADRVPWLSLHDVGEVVAFYAGQLDWELVLARAEEYRLGLSVRHVLERVHAEWSVPVPAQVLDRLRALRPPREEERVFRRLIGASRRVQRLWAELADSPDWKSRWGLWRLVALPPAEYMREHYRIRRPALVPLYYPYRWLRSLRRD